MKGKLRSGGGHGRRALTRLARFSLAMLLAL
jgi:hypothetical protein